MGFEVSESESEKCCRFEVLTVEGIKITVSWYVAPCGFVDTYQCFEWTWHFHSYGVQKSLIQYRIFFTNFVRLIEINPSRRVCCKQAQCAASDKNMLSDTLPRKVEFSLVWGWRQQFLQNGKYSPELSFAPAKAGEIQAKREVDV